MSVLAVNDETMLQHVLTDLEFMEEVMVKSTALLSECSHLGEEELNKVLASRHDAELALWRLRNFVEALRN